MKILIWFSVMVFFLESQFFGQTVSTASQSNPAFDEFPTREESGRMVKDVDLKSHPEARLFRTRLREAIGQKPDFAGYYKVVTWGCGTMCQTTALIDARDGKVYFAPFTSLLGVEHRTNSRLLIENPPAEVKAYVKDSGESKPKWLETIYWQWVEKSKSFEKIPTKG